MTRQHYFIVFISMFISMNAYAKVHVIYPDASYPSRCNQCSDFVDFSSQSTSYWNTSYYDPYDWRYDPDTATGDDDPVVYPDMQIN